MGGNTRQQARSKPGLPFPKSLRQTLAKKCIFLYVALPLITQIPHEAQKGADVQLFQHLLPNCPCRWEEKLTLPWQPHRGGWGVCRGCWSTWSASATKLPASQDPDTQQSYLSCLDAALQNHWEKWTCHFPSPPSAYHCQQRLFLLHDSSTHIYQCL